MSLGRAPSVEASLDIDLSEYAAGMKDARQQAVELVKIIENRKARMDIDPRGAEQTLRRLAKEVDAIVDNDAVIQVEADTAGAMVKVNEVSRAITGLDQARAVASTAVETDNALRELRELQARLDTLDDRPVHIQARAEVASAIRELQNLRREIGLVDDETINVSANVAGAGASMSGAFGGVGKAALGMTGGLLGAGLVMGGLSQAFGLVTGAGIGLNAQLESTTIQFETMMGSAEKAQEHVAFLFEFAKKTPFETAPIIEASRFLQLFGKDALNTTENLTRIGNASATAQAPIQELGFWVGRLYAAMMGGQPFGESAMRLQELGVLSAETRTEMEKMQKAGVDGSVIWQRYTQDLDKLDGAMEKQAGTWSGLTSTISDIVQLTAANVLAPWFEEAKDAMSGLIEAAETDTFEKKIEGWVERSREMATAFREWVTEQGPKLLEMLRDSLPAIQNITIAIGELTVMVGNTIGPLLTLYGRLKAISDLGTIPLPGVQDSTDTDSKGKKKDPGPFADPVSTGAAASDLVTQAYNEIFVSSTKAGEGIDYAARRTDEWNAAFNAFIESNKGGQVYLGNGVRLTDDATVAADNYMRILEQQASVNREVSNQQRDQSQQMEYNAAITDDLGRAQGELAQYTREYVRSAVEAANTDEELVAYQNALKVSADASNVTRREGLETTRVTTKAEGELEVALARVATAYLALGVVQRNNIQAQNEVNGVIATFQEQGAGYSSELSSLEGAYAAINERLAEGKPLRADEAEFLEDYEGTYARVSGAVSDATIQEGLATQAKVELWRAQEELNAALDRGESDLGPYNERLRSAQDYLSDVDPASGATKAIETLGTGIDKLVPLFQGLIDQMVKLNDTEVDPEVTMKKDLFEKGATEVDGDMITLGTLRATPEATLKKDQFDNDLDSSKVGLSEFDGIIAVSEAQLDDDQFNRDTDAAILRIEGFSLKKGTGVLAVDDSGFAGPMGDAESALNSFDGQSASASLTLDTVDFYSALEGASAMLPRSPAKAGPFRTPPNWSMLTDGMAGDVMPGVEEAVGIIDSYLPHSPAETGPLSTLPDWDAVFERLPGSADDASGEMRDAFGKYIDAILLDGDYLNDWLTYLPEDAREAALEIGQNLARSLDFVDSLEPLDFGFLFEGLDATAEDYAQQATERIADFITGLDVEALASGDALEQAEAALAKFVNARAIAEQMGLGPAVLAELDASIAAEQARVNAIGLAMGTEIVQGTKAALEAGEIAAALADFREGVFTGSSFANTDDRDALQERVDMLTLARDAAAELGDTESVGRLNAQIEDGNAELALMAEILGTDVVQAWQANEEAAAAAVERAKELVDTFQKIGGGAGGGDPRAALEADRRAKEIALDTARVTPGITPAALAQLEADYAAAEQALKDYESGFNAALANGVFTNEELFRQAQEGGETLRQIIGAGGLTSEQIEELYRTGDEGVRAVIEGIFGKERMAEIEAGWNDITAESYEALQAFKPEEITDQWIDKVLRSLAEGRIDITQAMELLADATGEFEDAEAIALINTYDDLRQSLADALIGGDQDIIDQAQADYDAFMLFLAKIAEATGMTTEEVLQLWQGIEDAAGAAATSFAGSGIGFGGSAQDTFDFETASLKDLLGAFVDDLDRTLTDNLVDTLSAAQEAAEYLDSGTLDALSSALGEQLGQYGLGDPLSVGAAVLEQLGLTREDLSRMGLSTEEINDLQQGLGSDFLDGSNNVVDAINQQTRDLIAAQGGNASEGGVRGVYSGPRGGTLLPDTMGAVGAPTATQTVAGGGAATQSAAAPAAAAPPAAAPAGAGALRIDVNLGGKATETYIVDVVTRHVRKELR